MSSVINEIKINKGKNPNLVTIVIRWKKLYNSNGRLKKNQHFCRVKNRLIHNLFLIVGDSLRYNLRIAFNASSVSDLYNKKCSKSVSTTLMLVKLKYKLLKIKNPTLVTIGIKKKLCNSVGRLEWNLHLIRIVRLLSIKKFGGLCSSYYLFLIYLIVSWGISTF